MLFLTKLHLQNFCSYEHYTFDFKRGDGSPYKYICFFGPNGIGKTTLLEAIAMLTMNQMGRDPAYVKRSLRKYVRNKDYNPAYERISGHVYKDNFATEYEDTLAGMIIEGTYELDGQSYIVRLTQNGFDRNDLAPQDNGPGPWGDDHLLYRQRVAHFISSDSDLSLSKFQLRKEQMETFERITSTIMRYPTKCMPPSGIVPVDQGYCTDFVLQKNNHNIHYKRMSAGERKISKSFSELLNLTYDLANPDPEEPVMAGWPRLLLFDNVEMHIYYDRHIAMQQCLKEYFPQQQIFASTHSGVLIERYLQSENDQTSEMMIDLEKINA
ncbi:MAG: AAA family ATPase [Promethearchaeota archaeon]|jgi:predicted ATP-binding protein involved in virulence